MATYSMAENLHRLIKETLDSGVAASIGEAEEMFRGFRLGFEISENDAHDRNHQAALLTGVALARRVFLGGVRVSCPGAVPCNWSCRENAAAANQMPMPATS